MAVVPRSIDPSGIAPVTDPSVVGGAPDASPTTLVLQYLRQRGYTPTTENVRRALEANQRDPGVIPGLRSDRPATEAEDQAAMARARTGTGGGAGNLVQEEGSFDTTSGRGQGPTTPPDRRDNPTTSAAPPNATISPTVAATPPPPVAPVPPTSSVSPTVAPTTDTSALSFPGSSLGASVLLGLPAAGAALYGADRLIQSRGNAAVNPPLPATGVGGTPLGPDPALAPPPPPETVFPGAATQRPTEPVISPTVMDKAVAPRVVGDINPVARPGSLDVTPPRGPVEPVIPPRPSGAPPLAPNAEVSGAAAAARAQAARLAEIKAGRIGNFLRFRK